MSFVQCHQMTKDYSKDNFNPLETATGDVEEPIEAMGIEDKNYNSDSENKPRCYSVQLET